MSIVNFQLLIPSEDGQDNLIDSQLGLHSSRVQMAEEDEEEDEEDYYGVMPNNTYIRIVRDALNSRHFCLLLFQSDYGQDYGETGGEVKTD